MNLQIANLLGLSIIADFSATSAPSTPGPATNAPLQNTDGTTLQNTDGTSLFDTPDE